MRSPSTGALRTQTGTPAGCSSRLWVGNAGYWKTRKILEAVQRVLEGGGGAPPGGSEEPLPVGFPSPCVDGWRRDRVQCSFIGQAQTRRVAEGRLSQQVTFWGRKSTGQ